MISLQQYLPFTVLKPYIVLHKFTNLFNMLQQYLPFTVLKRNLRFVQIFQFLLVATVLTVYGIETDSKKLSRCLPL